MRNAHLRADQKLQHHLPDRQGTAPDLEQKLGQTLVIANDADCFVLSELTTAPLKLIRMCLASSLTQAAAEHQHSRALSGPNAIAGEWGHNPMPWPLTKSLL